MKAIIFDFMRTLYNPKTKDVPVSELETLKRLGKFKFALVSSGDFERKVMIKSLRIGSFFDIVDIVEEKTTDSFQSIAKKLNVNPKDCFVVGDRIKKEIKIGNLLGMKTIWLKSGKFSREIPEHDIEKPDYIIKDLKKVLNIINKECKLK